MSVAPDAPGRSEPVHGPAASGLVELVFPVASDLLLLARLVVSSVSSRSGFDIEEIEDLRLAVDELCLSVLGGRRRGRLVLHVDGTPDQIEVWCHHDGVDDQDIPDEPAEDLDGPDDLSHRILDALVDDHGLAIRDGRHGARMTKRRALRNG